MRTYETVWVRLKTDPDNSVVISTDTRLHARIYKAIAKEKYQDTLYHLEMDAANKSARLSYVSAGNLLTVTLNVKSTLAGLF